MFAALKAKKWFFLFGPLLFVLCLGCFATAGESRPHFERSPIAIIKSDGTSIPFTVEVADTEDKQAYGLMHKRSLPTHEGMIFPFSPPHKVAFWMKNTDIPLDMLFVRPDGVIGRIVTKAQPEDETRIPSQIEVSAVIEINGGLSQKFGLNVGDKVDASALTLSH